MEEDSRIDWEKFDSKFVKFEENEPLVLVLSNWREVVNDFGTEKKPGVAFDVLEVDGKGCERSLETSSKALINALKPFVMEAESKKESKIKVRVLKTGSGVSTRYSARLV